MAKIKAIGTAKVRSGKTKKIHEVQAGQLRWESTQQPGATGKPTYMAVCNVEEMVCTWSTAEQGIGKFAIVVPRVMNGTLVENFSFAWAD